MGPAAFYVVCKWSHLILQNACMLEQVLLIQIEAMLACFTSCLQPVL